MDKKELFEKIKSLGLPKDDFAVFGSGPLLANDLVDEIEDIDIIAKGDAWQRAKKLGGAITSPSKKGKVVKFPQKDVEIHNTWSPGDWEVERLIKNADIINDVRFVDLNSVLESKRLTDRKKDKKHIKILKNYLERR